MHCVGGVNRSASLVVAYLMSSWGLSLLSAVDKVPFLCCGAALSGIAPDIGAMFVLWLCAGMLLSLLSFHNRALDPRSPPSLVVGCPAFCTLPTDTRMQVHTARPCVLRNMGFRSQLVDLATLLQLLPSKQVWSTSCSTAAD